ncbi:hypothetical protein EB796_017997 [Bugula neritina]|uniref:Uncharacterized protein n=1 Tax=Bugula neritina TaxID=10212 RepID=A0A7J7JDL3_BUGNE|nr:hypothetical protein EB796_017997 [Bugula neritina]
MRALAACVKYCLPPIKLKILLVAAVMSLGMFLFCEKKPPNSSLLYPSVYKSFRNVSFALLPKTGSTNILRMICITVGPKCTNITGYPDEYHYVPSWEPKVVYQRRE